jgi:hypothetical protein
MADAQLTFDFIIGRNDLQKNLQEATQMANQFG